jgi:DNA-binding NtrC family response regulator
MRKRVLIVDDEPDIRALLKEILDDEGYEVDAVDSALQALERKPRFLPDLVLLDIWMPEMDGVSLLKHWSERKDLTCPVVMMSGHGTVETAVEATRFGAYDFVEKPLSMAKLIRVVKAALSDADNRQDVLVDSNPELPVGNSRWVQDLRLRMQQLAQHSAPVMLRGTPELDVRVWANYLFSLKPHPMPVRQFGSDLQDLSLLGSNNVYVEELADLSRHNQQLLLSMLRQPRNPVSNARIVVASQFDQATLQHNSDLMPELAEYWRDAVHIPSLNEHVEDIPELLEYYVNRMVEADGLEYRHFGVAAQNLVRNHDWRGGLADLKLLVRRLLQQGQGEEVGLDEIQQSLAEPLNAEAAEGALSSVSANRLSLQVDLDLNMRDAREWFEREYLRTQLELCGQNVSELARKVGLERTNLYRKMKALGIQVKK